MSIFDAMIIILFGAPGVGKGTQATILSERLGIAHLSTGDAFRAAIKNQTDVGKLAQQFVDAGDLVPDDVVARIVVEAMADPSFDHGCILDGFPRTRGQADALDMILDNNGHALHRVINLVVDDAAIIERLLSRGRQDDTEDVIKNRLEVYRSETAPLLDHYGERKLLVTVSGIGSVEEVNQRVLDAVQME